MRKVFNEAFKEVFEIMVYWAVCTYFCSNGKRISKRYMPNDLPITDVNAFKAIFISAAFPFGLSSLILIVNIFTDGLKQNAVFITSSYLLTLISNWVGVYMHWAELKSKGPKDRYNRY